MFGRLSFWQRDFRQLECRVSWSSPGVWLAGRATVFPRPYFTNVLAVDGYTITVWSIG